MHPLREPATAPTTSAPRPAPPGAPRIAALAALLAHVALSLAAPAARAEDTPEPLPEPMAEPIFDAEADCASPPRPDCPYRFEFDRPMVEMPRRGVVEGAGPVVIEVQPPTAGRYHWPDPRTLVFTPERGALQWGHRLIFRVESAIPLAGLAHRLEEPAEFEANRDFVAAGKVASWPVHIGAPRFIAFLDDGGGLVGQGPIHALYDQPVDPRRFGRLITAMDDQGQPVPARVTRPRDLGDVWPYGATDRRHVLAIRLRTPRRPKVRDGQAPPEVVVSLPTWREPEDRYGQREAGPLVQSFTQARFGLVGAFETARLEWAPDGEAWEGGSPQLLVGFDRPVRAHLLEKHLGISPRPKDARVSLEPWEVREPGSPWRYGYSVRFSGLDPSTRYRVQLRKGMPDLFGDRLARTLSAEFRTTDRSPSLVMRRAAVMQEETRGSVELELRNVAEPSLIAYPVDSLDAARAADAVGRPVPIPEMDRALALNETRVVTVPLPADMVGLYRLEVTARPAVEWSDEALSADGELQITDLAATVKVGPRETLVWITRLGAGAPVLGAEVSAGASAPVVTDAFGVARVPTPALREWALTARFGDDVLVQAVDQETLTSPWRFGEPIPEGPRPLRAAVFTERGVYRPGETVYGHIVAPDAQSIDPPAAGAGRGTVPDRVEIQVTDARGESLANEGVALDRFGVGAFELALKADAAIGTYSLRVSAPDTTAAITRAFAVEAYRVPAFAVRARLGAGSAPPWAPGQRVEAEVDARYLHGGALADRAAQYIVERRPVAMRSADFPTFVFGADDAGPGAARVADGEGRLDAEGRLAVGFTVPPAESDRPQRYTLWTEVADLDRQTARATVSGVVHGRAVYLGTRPPERAVLPTGTPLDIPVVAVDPDGRARPGVAVEVTIERLENGRARRLEADGSVTWLNQTRRAPVERCALTTAAVPRRCVVAIARAGRYRVRIAAQGGAAGIGGAGFEFSAAPLDPYADGAPAAWPRFAQDRVVLVPDKPRYAPGDVARLLVESPFERGYGLVTLEREGVRWHRVFRFESDAPTVEIPIDATSAPTVYASVALVRGRAHDLADGAGIETGGPAFKMGYVALTVDPTDRRLAVRVTPQRATAGPGEPVAVSITATGPDGRPAQGQAVVMVVDEAVLGLTRHQTPDPIAELSTPDPLAVRTAESRLDLADARARRGVISPSAGFADDSASVVERVVELMGYARTLFRTTAFVDARVPIERGLGQVTFTLPDNLTTYRVMAIAVDDQRRVGAGEAGITVSKPLLVTPVAPRFVHRGDRLTLGALVHNAAADEASVRVTARVEGLTLVDPAGERRSGAVPAGGSAAFDFAVEVPDDGRAAGPSPTAKLELILRDAHDAVVDRVVVALPVLEPTLLRSALVAGSADPGETVTLDGFLPADRHPGSGQVEVRVATHRLSRLAASVHHLMDYPHGCVEQTTSGLHPLVLLGPLVAETGVHVDEETRRRFVEAGIDRLSLFRTRTGGLSYWPGRRDPHPFGTAIALNALVDARAAGFAVPPDMLDAMAGYLERHLDGAPTTPGRTAPAVLALQRMGRPQLRRITALLSDPALPPFDRALAIVAFVEADGAERDPELLRRAVEGLTGQMMAGRDRRGGSDPFGSPVRTRAAALLALAATPPALRTAEAETLANAIFEWLLDQQREGRWSSTQDNVFAIMAIARRHGQVGPSVRPGEIEVRVNGAPAALQVVPGATLMRAMLPESALADARRPGDAPMPAQVTLRNGGRDPVRVELRATHRAEVREPLAAGFDVRRSCSTVDGRPIDPDAPVPPGAVVRVRVEVDAATPQLYVAIDDRLPAGLEPMSALVDARPLAAGEAAIDGPVRRGLEALSHHEVRDSRALFYVDVMPAGRYAFTYLARATTPGDFRWPFARVEAMYAPTITGTTATGRLVVGPQAAR